MIKGDLYKEMVKLIHCDEEMYWISYSVIESILKRAAFIDGDRSVNVRTDIINN